MRYLKLCDVRRPEKRRKGRASRTPVASEAGIAAPLRHWNEEPPTDRERGCGWRAQEQQTLQMFKCGEFGTCWKLGPAEYLQLIWISAFVVR